MTNKFIPHFRILLLLLLGTNFVSGQNDSMILSYKDYLYNIVNFHPIGKQADLRIDFAEYEMLSAKGNFDPVLSSSWSEKQFTDKLYYRQFQNRLQIPTKLGLDVVAGFENTNGDFLNPADKTDRHGLWNIGIEANLLQGLLVDERRVALKQAKTFQSIAENQKLIILNNLLFDASLAYLNWQMHFDMNLVIDESIELAQNNLSNTKQLFENGEATAIDTLEAYLILQDQLFTSEANKTKLVKAVQKMENYLWFDDLPLTLVNGTKPEKFDERIFQIDENFNMPNLLKEHPAILEKRNKQFNYELKQKLNRDKLKPKLKVKYNPLLATTANSIAPQYAFSNFKWGFDFSFPLFLRSEKAAIKQGVLRIYDIELSIQNKQNELKNKIEASLEQRSRLIRMISLQNKNILGYKQLLDAENEKFRFGESSVFLINKRQEKYINGRLKLIELTNKLQGEILIYLYNINALPERTQ